MSRHTRVAIAIAVALAVSSCAMLEPTLPVAQPSIQGDWPLPPTTTTVPANAAASTAATADIGWRDFFTDENLEALIARALANNRDLRVAALERYFSQEEARRSAQLSLIAEVANVYLTLAADRDQRRLAQATLGTREESHALSEKRHELGAARAAFFPSVTLTGSIGSASSELSGLFDGGTQYWRFVPQVNVPIFEGGGLLANLGVATADRDIALAQYEKSIQQGFREVADALALTTTLVDQRVALQALVDAAARADELAQARHAAGRDSYLVRLESQRTLYLAQQSLIVTRLAEQSNRVTLYKVLGGGWKETGP
jgi:outer membrane protein TolC